MTVTDYRADRGEAVTLIQQPGPGEGHRGGTNPDRPAAHRYVRLGVEVIGSTMTARELRDFVQERLSASLRDLLGPDRCRVEYTTVEVDVEEHSGECSGCEEEHA